jgi:putative ABC transport system permease protein
VNAPVCKAAWSGVVRRRVQTLVVFVVVLASSAAGVLGLTLLTHANELFSAAIHRLHAPDVAVFFNSASASDAELRKSAQVAGVTQAAGPYPEVTATVEVAPPASHGPGGVRHQTSGPIGAPPSPGGVTIEGRSTRGGPLDDLTLNGGHWLTGPGQIVLAVYEPAAPIGSMITLADVPGKPRLKVVGYGGSVLRDEDAWVTPGEIAALRKDGAARSSEMVYDFSSAATDVDIATDVRHLEAALPAGAVTGYVSWLSSADQTAGEQSINTPFVVAFAIMALVLAVLIVASVVSGAVVAGYRRIGLLKSIGFTPGQIAGAYVGQVVFPALAGAAAGTFLGNEWVVPSLNNSRALFQVPVQAVPAWINVAVPLGLCMLGALAGLVPALRAGRLSSVRAIATGNAPRQGHGYLVHRMFGKLGFPRPMTVGLAAPFGRPSRSLATLAAILFGVSATALAVGLDSSLARVGSVQDLGHGQVQIDLVVAHRVVPSAFSPAQANRVEAALRSDNGTAGYVTETDLGPMMRPAVVVPGLQPSSSTADVATLLRVTVYGGRSAFLGWPLAGGSWYREAGEVVVDDAFLSETGLSIGNVVHMTVAGTPHAARIVGEIFGSGPPTMLTSWQTLGGAAAGLTVSQFDVNVNKTVSPAAFAAGLQHVLGSGYAVSSSSASRAFPQTDLPLIRWLTLLLAVLAAVGVLNSLLMAARERVHDLGVYKAIGMTPAQTNVMVICWVVIPAILAAVIGLPLALAIHAVTMNWIGNVAQTGMTPALVNVYGVGELCLIAVAGLGIAATGALLPATYAARSRTAVALRTE